MGKRLFEIFFDGQQAANPDPHVLMKKHEEHYSLVRAAAAERGMPCLELDVELDDTAKWEKVCAFLGKEIPAQQPWPYINEKEQVEKKIKVWARMLISAVMSRSFGSGRMKLLQRV